MVVGLIFLVYPGYDLVKCRWGNCSTQHLNFFDIRICIFFTVTIPRMSTQWHFFWLLVARDSRIAFLISGWVRTAVHGTQFLPMLLTHGRHLMHLQHALKAKFSTMISNILSLLGCWSEPTYHLDPFGSFHFAHLRCIEGTWCDCSVCWRVKGSVPVASGWRNGPTEVWSFFFCLESFVVRHLLSLLESVHNFFLLE